jgi:hypothetical protein
MTRQSVGQTLFFDLLEGLADLVQRENFELGFDRCAKIWGSEALY